MTEPALEVNVRTSEFAAGAAAAKDDVATTVTEAKHLISEKSDEPPDEGLVQEALERFLVQEKEDAWRLTLLEKNAVVSTGCNDDNRVVVKREKSIAKVQKCVSRLRRFTETDRETTLSEFNKLDVAMHLSEVAGAFCDGPVKQRDIPAMVDICSLLFQQYGTEFSSVLSASILRTFKSADVTVPAMAFKRRSLARLLVELLLVGVFTEMTSLAAIIGELCDCSLPPAAAPGANGTQGVSVAGGKHAASSTPNHHQIQFTLILHNISTLEFLCRKFGATILRTPGRRQQLLDKALGKTLPRQCALPKSVCVALRAKLTDFYRNSGHAVASRTHAAVVEQANANQLRRINKGSVDAESEARYANALTSHTRLRGQLESLADSLGLPAPTFFDGLQGTSDVAAGTDGCFVTRLLPSDNVRAGVDGAAGSAQLTQAQLAETGIMIVEAWEDETEKDFYVNLLNLADAVPACLLGIKEPLSNSAHSATKEASPSGVLSSAAPLVAGSVEALSTQSAVADAVCGALTPLSNDAEEATGIKGESSTVAPSAGYAHTITAQGTSEGKLEHKLYVLEQFFGTLCRATLASEVDTLAMKFFYEQLNAGKVARRRLVKLLMSTHRNDLHVLPSLSRFLATIGPFCKDVLQTVVEAVPRELKELVMLRDPLKLESQIKLARYMGELCKFRLLPTGTVLNSLNELLGEFSQNNVQTACNLIQCCGRFLAAEPGVGTRFQNIVQKMLRTKTHRNLPVHLELMVEDCYFQLFPFERRTKPAKQLPVSRRFIHWLIFEELHRQQPSTETSKESGTKTKKGTSISEISRVLNSLRRLNWDDPLICDWIKKAILRSTTYVSYPSVGKIAQLLCSLVPGHPDFVIACVDDLLETLQLSLEKNDYRDTPERVRMVKFIGELFNYRLLDTTVILQTLYQLIGFSGASSYGCETIDAARRLATLSGNAGLLAYEDFNYAESKNDATSNVTVLPSVAVSSESLEAPKNVSQSSDTSVAVRPLMEPTAPEDDGPDDFFRLQLVCVLLNVCGEYFCKGSAKTKMDRFLLCLQRYAALKSPLPTGIRYILLDTFEALRPKSSWCETLSDIDRALAEIFAQDAEQRRAAKAQNDAASGDPNSAIVPHDAASPTEEESLLSEESRSSVSREDDEDGGSTVSHGDDTATSSVLTQENDEVRESDENDKTDKDSHSDRFGSATDDDALEDELGADEDDEESGENRTSKLHEQKLAELQAHAFDMELSRMISQSLHDAKPSFAVGAQRSRIDQLLEDVRLPPIFKMTGGAQLTTPSEPAENTLRVRLVTRKPNSSNKVAVKLLDIPKQSRLCQAVYTKETEDAKEHERLKKFVIDSVARHRKEELHERQNEIRQQLFTSSRYRGGAQANADMYHSGHRRSAGYHYRTGPARISRANPPPSAQPASSYDASYPASTLSFKRSS